MTSFVVVNLSLEKNSIETKVSAYDTKSAYAD